MTPKTTSTFIIHHDRCKPGDWTANDVLLLDRYVRTGDLAAAAALSRRGMQLVMDERHEPTGDVKRMTKIVQSHMGRAPR